MLNNGYPLFWVLLRRNALFLCISCVLQAPTSPSPCEKAYLTATLSKILCSKASFLLVLCCPSGFYTWCTRCKRIVGGHGCLFKHILKDHASERKADTEHVEKLPIFRPDLQSIIDLRPFVLPDAWTEQTVSRASGNASPNPIAHQLYHYPNSQSCLKQLRNPTCIPIPTRNLIDCDSATRPLPYCLTRSSCIWASKCAFRVKVG